MKLYCFYPQGYGQVSFFVMSDSEQSARKAIQAKIDELIEKGEDDDYWGDDGYCTEYEFEGWGTDYYRLLIADCNQVMLNDND